MTIGRRGFISGLLAIVSSPAIVRIDSLMALPTKQQFFLPEGLHIHALNDYVRQETTVDCVVNNNLMTINQITREAVRLFQNSNAFITNINHEYERDFGFSDGVSWQPPRPKHQLTFAEWVQKVERPMAGAKPTPSFE